MEMEMIASETGEGFTRIAYAPAVIREKTQAIYDAMLRESPTLREGNFLRISDSDLSLMFRQYDAQFFNGIIASTLEENGNGFSMNLSRRMTRSAGNTKRIMRRCGNCGAAQSRPSYEIAVGIDLFFQTFREDTSPITVNGLVCTDRLQALQRVFEHEMVHLVEFMVYGVSDCNGLGFKMMAHGLFGHTGTTHQLATPKERFMKSFGIQVGARVTFHFDGCEYSGVVNRIAKRVTVLVESENGPRYSDGKHYAKFYVPAQLLRRVEPR